MKLLMGIRNASETLQKYLHNTLTVVAATLTGNSMECSVFGPQ